MTLSPPAAPRSGGLSNRERDYLGLPPASLPVSSEAGHFMPWRQALLMALLVAMLSAVGGGVAGELTWRWRLQTFLREAARVYLAFDELRPENSLPRVEALRDARAGLSSAPEARLALAQLWLLLADTAPDRRLYLEEARAELDFPVETPRRGHPGDDIGRWGAHDWRPAWFLALALTRMELGDAAGALSAFDALDAVRENPVRLERALSANSRAYLLATAADLRVADAETALRLARTAARERFPGTPAAAREWAASTLDTLATVQAATADPDHAALTQTLALGLAPASANLDVYLHRHDRLHP